MAATFVAGSSQFLYGSNAAEFNFKDASFTVAFLMRTTTTGNQALVAKGAAGSGASDKGWSIKVNDSTAGAVRVQLKTGQGAGQTCAIRETTATNLNNGSWHSVVVTFTTSSTVIGNNVINLFVDGTSSQGTLTQSGLYTGASTDNLSIGARAVTSSSTSFYTGELAEVGIWNEILTSDSITALGKGFSPRLIRPQGCRFCAPLTRNFIDLHSTALTNSGTVTVSAHPRIYG